MDTTTMIAANVATIAASYFLYTSGAIDRVQEWRSTTSVEDIWSSILPVAAYTCNNDKHLMQSRFLSYDPIIVYIEGFLTPYEARHLKKLAEPLYKSSVVEVKPSTNDEEQPASGQHEVGGETAWLGSPDPVVDCVRARAAAYQGFASNDTMDMLAVVKYPAGSDSQLHYDYNAGDPQLVDRKTTFFAVLEASRDLDGGATKFPRVEKLAWNNLLPDTWCRLIECNADSLSVRPIVGDALFWVNFREDGKGHERTAHTMQPVKGSKTGLNIWTYDRILD